jgi:hypothetical protein
MTKEEMMIHKARRGQFLNNAMREFDAQYGGGQLRTNTSHTDVEPEMTFEEAIAYVLNSGEYCTPAANIVIDDKEAARMAALKRDRNFADAEHVANSFVANNCEELFTPSVPILLKRD